MQPLTPRTLTVALIAASLSVLSACGEDREGSVEKSGSGTDTAATGTTGTTGTSTTPAAASGPVVATVDVEETEFELDPRNTKISKPGVVQFDVTNAGSVPHALEVEGPEGEVETATIQPGKKATLKADLSRAGTYVWYCPVGDHEQRGMKGKIVVAGGGSGTGTTTDESGQDDRSGKGGGEDDRSGRGGGEDDRSGRGGGVGGGY